MSEEKFLLLMLGELWANPCKNKIGEDNICGERCFNILIPMVDSELPVSSDTYEEFVKKAKEGKDTGTALCNECLSNWVRENPEAELRSTCFSLMRLGYIMEDIHRRNTMPKKEFRVDSETKKHINACHGCGSLNIDIRNFCDRRLISGSVICENCNREIEVSECDFGQNERNVFIEAWNKANPKRKQQIALLEKNIRALKKELNIAKKKLTHLLQED